MKDNDNYNYNNNDNHGKYAYDVYQNQGTNNDNVLMDEGAGVAQEAPNNTIQVESKHSKKEMVQMYINMGHECARLMNAKCVSEKLSNSRGENSLRFTCRHGHNFYLSVEKVQKTFQAITDEPNMTDEALDSLHWCGKCANYIEKLRAFTKNTQQVEVLYGANAQKITVHCKRCMAIFHVEHDQKIDQVQCNDCRQRDEEAYLKEAEMQ